MYGPWALLRKGALRSHHYYNGNKQSGKEKLLAV